MNRKSVGPYFHKDGVWLCAECAGLDREDVGYDDRPARPADDYGSFAEYMEDRAL